MLVGKLNPFLDPKSAAYLDAELLEKLNLVLEKCRRRSIPIVFGTAVRGPGAQGRLWCAGKSAEEIAVTKDALSKAAPQLAPLLQERWSSLKTKPCDVLPGNSWHQFLTAVNIFPIMDERIRWRSSLTVLIAQFAAEVGLKNPRPHHFQLSDYKTPLLDRDFAGTWTDIGRLMEKIYDI